MPSVMATHGTFQPSKTQAQTAVRDSLLTQYPTVASSVFTAESSVNAAPWGVEDSWEQFMWKAIDSTLFSHHLAVNGENFFTVAHTHSRRVSVLSRAPASSATQPGSATSVWASGAPPSVQNVEPQPANSKNPFLSTNAHWPLDGHYQVVTTSAET